ncbi:putative N-acetyltransferase YvbK [Thalassobacillus devorans]|uniref:N-acetyltransferase YvbK n=1 Tax=Thalassobacillus devorans TaxID=279813 RepID=A0ABQ1NK04_9BACI|nr:GNAT family N-acetyltransferase [Thalassobacillus devorans]NIK27560.1 ribosomal protein S18 acetylase RimI-like enzyme [Thalassobacillus devorans]GGC78706.1 putative N-acetyltransferase YvbK [Thalassobacillus devorans]
MNIRGYRKGERPPMELLLEADPSEQMVQEYLQRGECFIAEDYGEIVGVYVLLPTRPATVELVNIAVKASHQGKGLGRILITDAIEKAAGYGYQTIEIGTGNSSIGQLALYQKCGFRLVGIDRDFFLRHYQEPIMENGIQCRDMIRLAQELK